MRNFLLVMTMLGVQCAGAQEVINIAFDPQGEVVECYYDDFTHDSGLGGVLRESMMPGRVIRGENDSVFVTCITMPYEGVGYLVGTMGSDGRTITFKNRQPVYYYDTSVFWVSACDADGNRQADSGTFTMTYDAEQGVYSMGDVCLGMYVDNAQTTTYRFSGEVFTPKTSVEEKVFTGTRTCVRESDGKTLVADVDLYATDGGLYVKGLCPDYPDAWMWLRKKGQSYEIPAGQLLGYRLIYNVFSYGWDSSTLDASPLTVSRSDEGGKTTLTLNGCLSALYNGESPSLVSEYGDVSITADAWESAAAPLRGDVNGDGRVDVEDVNAVINIILKME